MTELIDKNSKYYFFIVIGIFLIIVSPDLLSEGMFFDGLTYSAIAKNLSHNIGSFWHLHYTGTMFNEFHEHPPLAIGLESLFFDILGDSMFTERIYSLTTYIFTGYFIVLIWKEIASEKYHNMGWLPILFWISIPTIQWGISNNMLENTMMIFTTLSILLSIKSLKSNRFVYIILSGISLFLAFLSKGPVGLYPLSIFFWIFIFNREYKLKSFIIDSSILITSTILPFLLMFYIQPESLDSLIAYFNKQVIGSINNITTVDSRFQIIINLLNDLIPAFIIALFIYYFSKKKQFSINKYALILIAIGLSGVVPMMISLKQSSFYTMTTFPLFSLAFALLLKDHTSFLTSKFNSKRIKLIGIILITIGLSSTIINSFRIGREKGLVKDLHVLVNIIPESSTISINDNMNNDWKLHAYFARYANISLAKKSNYKGDFLLTYKGKSDKISNYKIVDIELNEFYLYKKQ